MVKVLAGVLACVRAAGCGCRCGFCGCGCGCSLLVLTNPKVCCPAKVGTVLPSSFSRSGNTDGGPFFVGLALSPSSASSGLFLILPLGPAQGLQPSCVSLTSSTQVG